MKLKTIRSIRSTVILIFDIIVAVVVFTLAYWIRMEEWPSYSAPELWIIVITLISTLFISGTYFKQSETSKPTLPIRTFFISLIGGIICAIWVYMMGPLEFNSYFGRGVLPIGIFAFGILATLNRFLINNIYHLQESGLEILYLGNSSTRDIFLDELTHHSEVRSITVHDVKPQSKYQNIISSQLSIERLLEQSWNAIIIDQDFTPDNQQNKQLVSLRMSGIPVASVSEYWEKNWLNVPVSFIKDEWFLQSQGFSVLDSQTSRRFKQVFDFITALALLIFASPIILFFALLVKLSSPGPALFKQNRVGQSGKIFTIYKLRTMKQSAEQDGAKWASAEDPRITKLGQFLRKTRIDELPQCWNILKGDMSIIGPRPERPEFTEMLNKEIPYYELRHLIKPGITGWAQVCYPYGASVEDSLRKLQYDLYYIKNYSLILDLNILLRTVLVMLQRKGR